MGDERGAGPPFSRGPALVDSSSPRYGEKASYYSAVCLETREVAWMELEGNSNARTSETFLRQLRERHLGPLNVIWDNAPAPLRLAQEWRGVEGVPSDAISGAAAGEPPSTGGRLYRGTARTSTAASDRVVHHSTILEFDFPSYRTDAAQQRGQAEEVNRQN